MKKFTFLLITAFLAMGLNGWTQVFITEIADPDNNLNARYIELYNYGATDVDFTEGSGWLINKYTNGSATVSQSINLTGTILAGDFYIIAYNYVDGTFLSVYGFAADQLDGVSNGVAGGNGDDTIELIDGTGSVADFYGVQPHADLTSSVWEFEDGRAERALGATSGTNPPVDADWNTWSDGPGGDVVETQDAPGDFDPGAWIGASSGGNFPPTISNIVYSPFTVTSSTTVSVSAEVTDSDGTVDFVELQWGTASGVLTNYIEMSFDAGDTFISDTDIGLHPNGTIIYFQVYAEDDLGDDNFSSEMSYVVTDPASTTLPYVEPFTADLGDCYTYSVTGPSKNWIWSSGEYAYMSGYNTGVTEEDWLVLPGINLDDYANEFMSFDSWYQYGTDDEDNYLKLYYSTDYIGVDDPTLATWTELPYNPPAASQSWESSGYVNLTGITGTMVYIAFKYNYEFESYRNWGVDNIDISEYDQLDWANLQWPGSGNITVGTTYTVYAQAYEPGVTDLPGQGAGLVAWIGYSTTDTDPSTWTDWVLAPYLGEVGSNDEYSLDLGLEILSAGTYYYASRFQLDANPFQYGGFSGGFWDGVNNVSGVLTVNPPSAQIDWANVQWPPDGTITLGGDFTVYAQVYEPGVTDQLGQGADITAWVGYSTTDTDPATWTDWVPAVYNDVELGLNDEYMANIGAAISSTGMVYYASRFKLGLADYVYGGYNGGFWDGTTNVSGILTVNAPPTPALVISEVMQNPSAVFDSNGEWFEIYNAGTSDVDIDGYYLRDFDSEVHQITNGGPLVILAGDFLVLGINADNLTNGGVDVDYQYASFNLSNSADEIQILLSDDVTVVDEIAWDGGPVWPDPAGASMTLHPDKMNIIDNDNGENWYEASTAYGDGDLGTPGTPNDYPNFTVWTGTNSADWFDSGNWTNGLPTASLDATIPDVGVNPYPVIAASANANNIYVAAAATLTIAPGADLTTAGQVDVDGGFYMSSNAAGVSASFIDNGVTGGGTFYFDRDLFCSGSTANEADPYGWHYLAAPIDGLSTDDLLDYYVNQWNEVGNVWMNFEGTEPCTPYPTEYLDDVEAWSINLDTEYACPTPGTGNIVEFEGPFWSLHTGGYSTAVTATGGSFSGWNMIGNPYPSAIDPAAFDWTGFENGTYGVAIYDGCAGNYLYSNLGNGYSYKVGPTQGFFMLTSGATDFILDGSERVHDNGTTIYKDAVNNLLTIEATGEGTSDLAYIRFMEGSATGMDVADFPKLVSTTEGLAQIYTTAGDEMLAVNALPTTPIVPMGFTSVTTGEYTISAIETSDFSNVVLEDRFTGEQTDLLTDSYTFNYTVNDDANRFFVHFTPLGIGDNLSSSINIWSNNHSIYVQTPEVNGEIVVFNMMGQEVTRTQIESGLNVIPVSEANAFYVVKIVGSEVSKTGKVYVN